MAKRQKHSDYWKDSIFKEHYEDYVKDGRNKERMPLYCANGILELCKRMGGRANFRGYPFVEEMIMDAVECSIRYFDNFDPDKGNSFSYFSRVAWTAFLRRIKKEKQQYEIKLAGVREWNRLDDTIPQGRLNPAEKAYLTYVDTYLDKLPDEENEKIKNMYAYEKGNARDKPAKKQGTVSEQG